MKKLFLILILSAMSAVISIEAGGADKKITLHFFESAICPSCRQADEYFKSSVFKSRCKSVKIIKYELMNQQRVMDAANKRNMQTLVSMLNAIKNKKGNTNFIFRDRNSYEYYSKNGIPYYKRQERYSRKDEPIPVPMFLINDKLFVGFNPYTIGEIEKAAQ